MKSLGVPITAERYVDILIVNLQNQPMYKLFFSFNTMNLGQQGICLFNGRFMGI